MFFSASSLTKALIVVGAVSMPMAAVAHVGHNWSDLPWPELEAKLASPDATLVQTSPADYVAQCYPEFENPRFTGRSQYRIVDQPSGLCMNHFYCGYRQCNPLPLTDEEAANTTITERTEQISIDDSVAVEIRDPKWLDVTNPAYNLPSTVLFPKVAGDIAAAVSFAVSNGIEVSVKNSGHSYAGSSTKKDTLHINMNRYTKYSADGIEECDVLDPPSTYATDLSDQPCALATARGKPAVLRVGGGEIFGDVYINVKSYNEALPDGYKFHLVGGAAGTVSPMGWTWQGGLAGTTAGRKYGFGVDQVIRIDMVLPSGIHVRFGPTKWDNPEEGHTVPQTTEVSGVCQTNPEETDETKWVWKECEADINFLDLWFAMLGGGGGTWGVVTSVILQLHEYEPLGVVFNGIDTIIGCGLSAEYRDTFEKEWWDYYIQFMFDPQAVGVTEEESNNCASSTYNTLLCYGEEAAKPYMEGWTRYIEGRSQTLADDGIPIDTINLVANCPGNLVNFIDYTEMIVIKEGPLKGKANDAPAPGYVSSTDTDVNLIMPAKYILENRDSVRELIIKWEQAPYCAFGGRAAYDHDGANSLSKAHRLGGWMLLVTQEILTESFMSEEFPKMFDTTDPTDFPSFVGGNHLGPNMFGPLKEDWSKPCPLNWTLQEREDKCIPIQESLYGTKTLKRLEAIKESIDPKYVLDCFPCIGNNRDKTSEPIESFSKTSSANRMSHGIVSSMLLGAFSFLTFLANSL